MDKLENFLSGFGAAIHLSQRAKESNSFIEQITLFANIIDAFLRLSLIMKEQLEKNNNEINELYLFQSDEDKIISEKNVYHTALEKKIITDAIYSSLISLYQSRNKIIHRYIISDIKTYQLKKVSKEYENVTNIIKEEHKKLLREQQSKNIGISISFIDSPTSDRIIHEILKKHEGFFKKK